MARMFDKLFVVEKLKGAKYHYSRYLGLGLRVSKYILYYCLDPLGN